MNESAILAQYVANTVYEDLPAKAVEMTKMSLLDALGVTLAAGGLCAECEAFVEIARESGGKKESTILGFGDQVPAHMAAFANGAMAHALDFEDAHDLALVHPNAATVPAALAIAESIGNVNGKDFITAWRSDAILSAAWGWPSMRIRANTAGIYRLFWDHSERPRLRGNC